MINQQLLDFIESQLLKGVGKETIIKELLDAGWLQVDIDEGFNIINTSMNSLGTPTISRNENNLEGIIPSNYSNKKISIIVIILLIVIGIASGYYFRNEIPIIKNFTKSSIVSENEINKEQNQENIVIDSNQEPESTSEDNNNESEDNNNEIVGIDYSENSISSGEEVVDCNTDVNCFIKLADECKKVKVKISKINEEIPMFNIGNVDIVSVIEVNGKEDNNCVARMKILDYKLKYNEEGIALLLQQGNSEEDIKNEEINISKSTIGSGQICKIDYTKKLGQALNELFINTPEDLEVKCSDSTCSYNSSLICQSFSKLNDN